MLSLQAEKFKFIKSTWIARFKLAVGQLSKSILPWGFAVFLRGLGFGDTEIAVSLFF